MTTAQAGHPGGQPVITVTRGLATPAEIATFVAVLLSARTPAAITPTPESARPSRWAKGSRARAALARPDDRGAKVIARALRDADHEVICTGLHQTPAQIVACAIQEDASVVGLSVLSGAHLTATGTAEGKVPA